MAGIMQHRSGQRAYGICTLSSTAVKDISLTVEVSTILLSVQRDKGCCEVFTEELVKCVVSNFSTLL